MRVQQLRTILACSAMMLAGGCASATPPQTTGKPVPQDPACDNRCGVELINPLRSAVDLYYTQGEAELLLGTIDAGQRKIFIVPQPRGRGIVLIARTADGMWVTTKVVDLHPERRAVVDLGTQTLRR
jgi:hypothetical protein